MVALLLTPAAADAHTHLADLRPEPEAVLPRAPHAVQLVFNQPVDLVGGGIAIRNARRDAGVSVVKAAGGRLLVLKPRRLLRAGRVDVRFRVLSKDGHVLKGRFGFNVRRGAAPAPGSLALAATQGGREGAVGVTHGLHHLLFILALGLAMVGPLVLTAAGVAFPAGLLRGLCLGGAAVSVLCATVTWVEADGQSLLHALTPAAVADTAGTASGQGWLLRAGLWLLAAVIEPKRLMRGGVLAGVALSLALSGHADSHGGTGSIAVDAAHLVAAGAWLGGLATLGYVFLRHGDTARSAAAFGRMALLAFAALVLTGVLNAILRVGSFDALVREDYGLLVLAKLGLALLIAATAATSALRHRPAGGPQVAVELGLGAAALTLAAILVETAPVT